MLSLEKCAAVLQRFDYKIDNDILKELRDYLYLIASLQVMNDDSEADINNFVDCKSND